MKTNRIIFMVLLVLVLAVGLPISIPRLMKVKGPASSVSHEHQWGMWGDPDPDENNGKNAQFIQFRNCTNCGLAEFRVVLEVK
jgi:hypothetical protein